MSRMRRKEDRVSVVSSNDTVSMYGDTMSMTQDEHEKILVSIRLRPLNQKEIDRNDICDWECINNNTILFKSTMPDRSMSPTAYTFDRVFGPESHTREVYEEGAKEIALLALSGINSTIFAYGQTSSGKTFTMSGIIAYALADIYEYIEKHKEREFVFKFSAMEIYNEVVRDLLTSDINPLRVLDDPERGTVVEKLIEETLVDWNHLMRLLSVCEAQRQVGETSLNETSSRSHQILRLTIESSAREYAVDGSSSTLTAAVNFVDLAGSERASQTNAAGVRLKEGSHINRSLLTLGTVIRKLSKGRNGHVPYRDSKLTRILQNSLGGNSRTAIICTMSPARSHFEQTRNTLLFANCAKEVATNAQVNVVMSDKALVKQLQKELARLESQLIGRGSISVCRDLSSLLREKELLIEQMDKEIKELTLQRDLAQSHVESLLKAATDDRALRVDEYPASETSEVIDPIRVHKSSPSKDFEDTVELSPNKQIQQILENENPDDNFLLDGSTPRFSGFNPYHGWEDITKTNNEGSEAICTEVRCTEMNESIVETKTEADLVLPGPDDKLASTVLTNESKQEEDEKLCHSIPEDNASRSNEESEAICTEVQCIEMVESGVKTKTEADLVPPAPAEKGFTSESKQEEDKRLCRTNPEDPYDDLKQKLHQLQEIINHIEPSALSSVAEASSFSCLAWKRSKSRKSISMTIPSELWGETEDVNENVPPAAPENGFLERPGSFEQKPSELDHGPQSGDLSTKGSHDVKIGNLSRRGSEDSLHSAYTDEEIIKEMDVEDTTSVIDFATAAFRTDGLGIGASPRIDGLRNLMGDARIERVNASRQAHTDWILKFERYRRKIVELWGKCNVPLIHRSYFFLLFKGVPSDRVYMEVELRRLRFLRESLSTGTSSTMIDDRLTSPAPSLKALNREREMLARQLQKKHTRKEREDLFKNWGINLETKQRSLQLVRLVWTDTRDMNHVKDSAALVAKLVGFVEPQFAPKEMFALSLATPPANNGFSSWRDNMSSLLQ